MSWPEFWRRASRNRLFVVGGFMVLLLLLAGIFANFLTPYDPYTPEVTARLAAPSLNHPLGTDWAGRDSLCRLLYGTRITLAIALGVVALAGLGGVLLGLVAGYFGGVADATISAVTNLLFAFPTLVLALTISVLLGPSTRNMVLVLAILYAPNLTRLTRGIVLQVKQQLYIESAVVTGCTAWRIIVNHVLPNVLGPVLVYLTIGFSYAILSEAGLTYLGFGAQPPDASWGAILNEGRPTIWISVYSSLFAGMFIALAVMGFNLLGDGLRDLLDPTLRAR